MSKVVTWVLAIGVLALTGVWCAVRRVVGAR